MPITRRGCILNNRECKAVLQVLLSLCLLCFFCGGMAASMLLNGRRRALSRDTCVKIKIQDAIYRPPGAPGCICNAIATEFSATAEQYRIESLDVS